MTAILEQLITEARAASSTTAHWVSEGGRACPLGWWDCSQAVYKNLANGAWDHGEVGGPGWKDCQDYCKHGLQPVPANDDDFAYATLTIPY